MNDKQGPYYFFFFFFKMEEVPVCRGKIVSSFTVISKCLLAIQQTGTYTGVELTFFGNRMSIWRPGQVSCNSALHEIIA